MKQRKIKVGILGFGSRGVSLARPLLDNGLDVELKWIIDPDIKQAEFFFKRHVFDFDKDLEKEAHPKVNFVKSLSEVNKEEIDAILLTASEKVRTMLFEEALDFDKPLLMEKGLSNSLEGSAKILEAYRRKKNARVFMAFNLRYNPLTSELKKILKSGEIGKLLFINYIEKLKERHGANYYRRFHSDINQSGGMLITKSCHDFDLVNYLADDKPDRLFASCRQVMFGLGGEKAHEHCHTCPVAGNCEYEMTSFMQTRKEKKEYHDLYISNNCANSMGYKPDICVFKESKLTDMNNVIIDYQNGMRLNYSQVLFSAKPGREIAIFGTNGSIQYNLNDQELRVHSRWNKSVREIKANDIFGNHGGADPRMINDFMNMVRSGKEKESRIEDGAWALATGFAAYRSSDEGTWIDVKEAAKEAGINI